MPLSEPVIAADGVSAQVAFRQSKDGVVVSPVGSIQMHLGSQGELLSCNSEDVSPLQVGNERKLDGAAARAYAEATATANTSLRTQAALPVRVMEINMGSPSTAQHAYQFNVQGHQTIIDAATGKILFQRIVVIFRRKFSAHYFAQQ